MSDRAALARRVAPLLLLALLAATLVAAPAVGRWDRDGSDGQAAASLLERIDDLPPGGLALVAFDPDLLTYAEVRPAARGALAALAEARARVAIVSFTPEGRALAAEELSRIGLEQALDIGFIPGGEAALVAAVRGLLPDGAEGPVAEAARAAGGGLAAFDLAIIVGGGDIGPRSWVEQVAPRAPELTLAAIVPAFQRPQLEPYRASGQLAALVAGPDAIAAIAADDATLDRAATPVAAGLLVAIAYLLATALVPHLDRRRATADDDEAEPEDEP